MNPYSVQKLPSDILLEIAQKHRKIRRQLKYSQKELAMRSGVSLGSIKRFEQTGKISFESILGLAHVLGRLNDFEKLLQPIEDLERIKKLFAQ